LISNVAFISYHTCPLLTPGAGDAGGMNVVVARLAEALSRLGIGVDVYTRRSDPAAPEIVQVMDNFRVIHIDAGPVAPAPISELIEWTPVFTTTMLDFIERNELRYDLVHAHYWLSGRAGLAIKAALGIPMAHSSHTLGLVKDFTKRWDEPETPDVRIATEEEVIAGSDCLIAATEAEAQDLIEHYAADPTRLCITPPGVDHEIFFPADSPRAGLQLGDGPLALFVGRIQPLKGLDVALEAVAVAKRLVPELGLLVVGGASGEAGSDEMTRLKLRAEQPDLAGAVEFRPAVDRNTLPPYYRTADVLLMPSRSESFGLVALESQACGTPVIASNVGGLGVGVNHEKGGLLIDGWDPDDYASALVRVLTEPTVSESLAHGAVHHARRFTWERTTYRLLELYAGIGNR
jgi:D-inositol-3-phosphate glycosyltransferase